MSFIHVSGFNFVALFVPHLRGVDGQALINTPLFLKLTWLRIKHSIPLRRHTRVSTLLQSG